MRSRREKTLNGLRGWNRQVSGCCGSGIMRCLNNWKLLRKEFGLNCRELDPTLTPTLSLREREFPVLLGE